MPLVAALAVAVLAQGVPADDAYRAAVRQWQQFLMDGHVVVGVGNIYANEALHEAGIDPRRQAGRISLARYERLAAAVRRVLAAAIAQGGTTLRDYVSGSGAAGYFARSLRVYGRAGQPCPACGGPVRGAECAAQHVLLPALPALSTAGGKPAILCRHRARWCGAGRTIFRYGVGYETSQLPRWQTRPSAWH